MLLLFWVVNHFSNLVEYVQLLHSDDKNAAISVLAFES